MHYTTLREMVEDHGITLVQLRHYERLGLVRSMRGPRSRRYYSDKNMQRLKSIIELSTMGFLLAEIRELLEDGATVPSSRIEAMVRRFTAKRDDLDSRILRLKSYSDR